MSDKKLRLLSYNIQAGLTTHRYSDYITHSWQHLIPLNSKLINLNNVARVIAPYDIVGLQEVDGGSLRSGFLNQADYLAQRSGLRFLSTQVNRRFGPISHHCNAILSRFRPSLVRSNKLPGLIPGRGLLHLQFGEGKNALHVFTLHLSLSRYSRKSQIDFVAEQIADYSHVIVMGDFNFRPDSPDMKRLLLRTQLREPLAGLHTFPSWKPDRQLDHILVSPSLHIVQAAVLPHRFSDHCPISMEVILPKAVTQVLNGLHLSKKLALTAVENHA